MTKKVREAREHENGCALFNSMGEFAAATFPDATPVEHLKKLKIEAQEAIEESTDAYEYADCLLTLFAAAYKAGLTYTHLLKVAKEKLTICKSRKWVRQADGTYQHK